MEDDKIYYTPGCKCKCRHFEHAPEMYVVEKKTRVIKSQDGVTSNAFIGIVCRWFDANDVLQEALFSSKDLEKI